MDKVFYFLLVFVPVAILLSFTQASPVVLFFVSAIAIIPLAKFIGEATDELSSYVGSALGGLLNATFGNVVELMIAVIAIREGLPEVVKASITGSIIGNLLLVLGMAMFFGGYRHKKQQFNKTAALTSSSNLLLAVIALVIPAIFLQTSSLIGGAIINELSVFVSVFLIIVYIAGLVFTLITHKHLYTEEVGRYDARWSKKKSLFVLGICTLLAAWMSEILVGSIHPLVASLGWTELFIGVVFVAIIGNVAEHVSAITMAIKNRMDLALQIAIGSATQIAMFVAPILVFAGLFLGRPFALVFNIFELVAIVLSVMITNLVVQDGESNWLEGLQLVMSYAIMAVAFFFHQ